MIFVFAFVVVGLITGLFFMASVDGADDEGWAYEYEIKRKPDCFTRSKRRGSCDGACNMNDFVSNDCADCPYWRGKC